MRKGFRSIRSIRARPAPDGPKILEKTGLWAPPARKLDRNGLRELGTTPF